MKQDRLLRHLLVAFLLAIGLYVVAFWLIESRRVANTPWTVSFEVDSAGYARIEIHQQSLGLEPVEIRFTSPVTNIPTPRTEVLFKDPKPVPRAMPVGQCLFEDLTFLPGTVTLNVAGVDIQMLPRVLTLGTNEIPWRKARIVQVEPGGIVQIIQ